MVDLVKEATNGQVFRKNVPSSASPSHDSKDILDCPAFNVAVHDLGAGVGATHAQAIKNSKRKHL